jgi:hypothetical protein
MRRIAIAGSLLAAALTTPAGAQVVDFHEYASPVTTEYPATIGDPLIAGGFDFYEAFSSGGRNVLGTWGFSPGADPVGNANRPVNIGGSTAMFATTGGVEVDMYVHGANIFDPHATFDLFSIDVAHQFNPNYFPPGNPLQNFSLTFFGYQGVGAAATLIQQQFAILAPTSQLPTLATLTFDRRWRNMSNVWWFQSTAAARLHQFTNVNAVVLPEPGTYLLLLTGLAGVAAVARRRRRG